MHTNLSRAASKLAIVIALLPLASAHAQSPQLIRVAYTMVRDSHYGAGVDAFAKELKAQTGERYRVEHIVGSQAGGEIDILRKVRDGDFEMGSTSTGPLGGFVPTVKVFDLPFLFTDYRHARRTLDGPIGQKILATFPDYGMQGLAWTENGFRHMTNNRRPIVYPADLAALKMRTMENSVHMESMRVLHSTPIPIGYNKLYKALQDGELDGQENSLPVILTSKFSDTQRYLSLTQHFYSLSVLLISPKFWAKLPPADREAFVKAAQAGARAQRDRVNREEFVALTALADQGMRINAYVDTTAFRQALRPKYSQLLPGVDMRLVDEIRNQ